MHERGVDGGREAGREVYALQNTLLIGIYDDFSRMGGWGGGSWFSYSIFFLPLELLQGSLV